MTNTGYSYDPAGNLSSDDTTSYIWNALDGQAQVITRRGKPAVVVIACDEYARLTQYQSGRVVFSGSPRWIRTNNKPVNSRLLYH